METDKTYQVVRLNELFGDKLTTLSPNTVGIPNSRSDEYIKQVYDIDALLKFNYENIDFGYVQECFARRCRDEAQCRKIEYNYGNILKDIKTSMENMSFVDILDNKELKRMINNFKSLYLRKGIMENPASWAITGCKIKLLSEGFELAGPITYFTTAGDIERKLQFDTLTGLERGQSIRRFTEEFLSNFGQFSAIEPKILKGKHPARIFWAIVSPANINNLAAWVDNFFETSGST